MGAIAGALPDYPTAVSGQNIPQPHQQGLRGLFGASTSALVYQLQQISQLPGQFPVNYPGQSPYNSGFAQGQYPTIFVAGQGAQFTAYPLFNHNRQRSSGPSPLQLSYPNFPQQTPQYLYYTPRYTPQCHLSHSYPTRPAQQPGSYGRRPESPFKSSISDCAEHGTDLTWWKLFLSKSNHVCWWLPGRL